MDDLFFLTTLVQCICQKILLKLWQKLPEFEYQPGQCRFRTWLCRVIHNQVIDFTRQRQRLQKKQTRVEESELRELQLPDVERMAEKEWKQHIGQLAWDNIKGGFSASVVEAFLLLSDGRSVAEISDHLKLARNTINVYKKRVREKLLREIRRLDNELG